MQRDRGPSWGQVLRVAGLVLCALISSVGGAWGYSKLTDFRLDALETTTRAIESDLARVEREQGDERERVILLESSAVGAANLTAERLGTIDRRLSQIEAAVERRRR